MFTTSNVHGNIIGTLKVLYGDWSGAEGDAAGTVNVNGARIYLAEFSIQDTTSPTEKPGVSTSVANGLSTATVYYHSAVTTGRFYIVYD